MMFSDLTNEETFSNKDEIIFIAYINNLVGLHFKHDRIFLCKEGVFFGLNEGKPTDKYIIEFKKNRNKKWEIKGYGYPVLVTQILEKFKEIVATEYDFRWCSDNARSYRRSFPY